MWRLIALPQRFDCGETPEKIGIRTEVTPSGERVREEKGQEGKERQKGAFLRPS